ncbi:MAG: metal-dependent hydrolase [Candidatus Helarchaeota archaeon]
MPDWLSHLGIAYLIIWVISKLPKYDESLRKYYALFMIGMVEPDIERIFAIIATAIGNPYFQQITGSLTMISHSILGVTIISLFITSFFPHENDTKRIFLTLFIGGIGHLLLDMIMWPWQGFGIAWFYPLHGPEFSYSFHLVWPGGFLPLIITSIAVGVTFMIDLIQRDLSVFNYNFSKEMRDLESPFLKSTRKRTL